jgi:TolC family type I secretion outer membrane protein
LKLAKCFSFVTTALVIGSLQGSAIAATAEAMALEEILANFMARSPYVKSETLKVKEAEKGTAQSFGRLLPEVNLSASYRQPAEDALSSSNELSRDYALTISQPLFAGGSRYYQWQADQAAHRVTEANVQATIQNLKLEVIDTYLAVLSQKEIYQRQVEQVNVLKEQLEVVQTRFEAGSAIVSDLRQAEARLAASQGAAALAKSELAKSRSQLVRLTGINSAATLQWPKLPGSLPENSQNLYQQALKANPQLKAANEAIDQQESTKASLYGQYLPEVSAEYRILKGRTASSFSTNSEQRREIALGVSVNLFNGLQSSSQLAQQSFALQRTREQLEIVKRQLHSASKDVFATYRAAQSNLNSLEIAVDSAKEAARAFQLEYQNGTRSLSDLLDVEQELLQSQIGLIQAKLNYFLAAYQIQLVAGTL